MELNGKEIKLKLDLGALKEVKKLTGKNFFAIKQQDFDPDLYSALLYACAKRGGSEISQSFIDNLPLRDVLKMQKVLDQLMGDFMPEGEATGKNQKRQN